MADSYGIYNGILVNGAGYLVATTTQPYSGYGAALTLTTGLSQSFLVSTPIFNLAYTSFTVEAWIYPTFSATDRGIFSQCACSTCSNQCFYFVIRANKLYADFTSNYVVGSTVLQVNTWYHVAFVYNYGTQHQILYVNGVQDGVASNAQPYQGTNGSIQIGAAQEFATTYYFYGYIDNVKLTTRVKSSTELLYAASLTAYYSFDFPLPNNDNGPNSLNGSSTNTAVTSGRVNQAMRFSSSPSYFQTFGFYQMDYSMTTTRPFSISLWINPSSLLSCTIIQITKQQSSGACNNMLGITSSTGQTGQLIMRAASGQTMVGPFLTLNTWMHVSLTYSSLNGLTLYTDGILFGSSGSFSCTASLVIAWIQIGYNFACGGCCSTIANVAYQGAIDEIYIHSRELTQADVTTLANP